MYEETFLHVDSQNECLEQFSWTFFVNFTETCKMDKDFKNVIFYQKRQICDNLLFKEQVSYRPYIWSLFFHLACNHSWHLSETSFISKLLSSAVWNYFFKVSMKFSVIQFPYILIYENLVERIENELFYNVIY